MNEFLTQESPGKVLGLLGVAVTSVFFLFAVTMSNASFQKQYQPFPVAFSPAQVMGALDVASNSYSKFLYANLITPASEQYAFVADNVGFIADNAGPQVMQLAGLQGMVSAKPQVAGASTQVVTSPYYTSSGSGFGIYSILIR